MKIDRPILVLAAVFLVLAGPIGLLYIVSGRGADIAQALPAIVFTALIGARIAILTTEVNPNLLTGCFYVYTYINWGLTASMQIALDRYPWGLTYGLGEAYQAMGTVVIGLFAFELGIKCAGKLSPHSAPTEGPEKAHALSPKTCLLFAAALAVSVWIFVRLRWWDFIFSYRVQAGEALGEAAGSTVMFQILVKTMWGWTLWGGLYALDALISGGRFGSRWRAAIFVGVLVPFSLMFANPIGAPRYWMATVVGSYCLLIAYRIGPRLTRLAPVMLVMVYALAFPFLDYYRSEHDVKVMQQSSYYSLRDNLVESYTSGDYDALTQMMNAYRVADNEGLQYGRQALGSLLFWIPRYIWAEKPEPTSFFVASGVGYSYINLSAPLWVEGFVDFHIPGVVIILFLYGLLTEAIFRGGMQRGGGSFIAYCILVPYSIYLIRGALMSAGAYISPVCLIWALTLFVEGRSTRPWYSRLPDGRRQRRDERRTPRGASGLPQSLDGSSEIDLT